MTKITYLNAEIFVLCLGYRLPTSSVDALRPTRTYKEFTDRVESCLPDDYLSGSNESVEYIIERGYMFCLEYGCFRPYEVRWKYGNIRNMEPFFTTVFGQYISNSVFKNLYNKGLRDAIIPSNYIPSSAEMRYSPPPREASFDDLLVDSEGEYLR